MEFNVASMAVFGFNRNCIIRQIKWIQWPGICGNRRDVRPNQNIEKNHNITLNGSLSIVLTIHIDIIYPGFTNNHVFLPFFFLIVLCNIHGVAF